jgi:hypothetical protein
MTDLEAAWATVHRAQAASDGALAMVTSHEQICQP